MSLQDSTGFGQPMTEKTLSVPQTAFLVLGMVMYVVFYYFFNFDIYKSSMQESFFLLGGMVLGLSLCVIDEKYLYEFYSFSDEPKHQHDLVTRSLLFLLSYFPLSFFIISSSGSTLGSGIVLGMGVFLAKEIWMHRDNNDFIHQRYLYQLARKLSHTEVWWAVRGFISGVVVLLLLAL